MLLICFAPSHLRGASAYWSFQTDQAGGTYSSSVTLSDFPNGNPTLSATGSSLANLNNFGAAHTAPDGSVWQPGKAIAWNGQNGSTGNTMQVNLNARQLKDFSLRFKFRNNQTRSSGNLVNAFSSFQYNIGSGYVGIPSANLSILNNTSWSNEWTMDLSSLSAIEGAASVILKWTLPDFESTGSTTTQLRIDDLQITATEVPPVGALTNSTVIAITKTSNAQPSGYTYPLAIEVPSGISSPMPVAILLHGRGGNGNGMISQFRSTLDNHILIAPTGYQNSWNITEEPSDLPDIAFLQDLITQVKTYPNVDTDRIRFVGTSNGSGMTNRVFVEIDDPGIDIICPIVSQLHTGNYRNGKFYYPINEQNTGAAHGANKGYDTLKTPVTGRRVLAITNFNDPLIPYTGGPKFGSDFLHSQLSAYAIAVSQGYSGSQIPDSSGVQLYQGIHKYSYLNDQVMHIKGSADHGLDANLKAIIKEFFNRPPPPTAPTSLIASAKSTEQINLQWNDNSNDESGFVVEKSSSGNSGWTIFKTLPANTVIASDLAVGKGETWYYRVKATRADGNSSWSTVSGTTVQRSRQLPISNYNVLFINIDDLKPMLGSFGNTTIKTPKMDLLSASSLNFTNAHCQQAICTASRASYLTGLRPDSTRVWDLNTHLRDAIPNVVTIPQHFKENGYNSHGIGKIFHGTTLAMQDGEKSFDSWEKGSSTYKYHEPGHAALEDNKTSPLPATDKGEFLRDGVTPVGDSDYSAGVIAGLAKTKLAQFKNEYENNSKPFFLGVGFYKPHLPFTAPKPYWDLYDPITDIDLSGYDGTKKMPTGVNEFAAPYGGEQSGYSDIDEPPSTAQARRLTHAYMACVSYVDHQVGKIMDELDRLGLADSTIVVLFGDHGFHLADHGAFWAKHSNFDNATRTPLIVRVPGMQTTGTFDTPVGLVDVFPTLVDLCSLPYPKQPNGLFLEGTSLLPLVEDPTQPWKKGVFSQYQRRIWKKTSAGDTVDINNPGNGIGYSIRTKRYRYTEWWRTETTAKDSKGNYTDRDVKLFNSPEMKELYDYNIDPNETTNLVNESSHSQLVAELAALLAGGDGWANTAVAPAAKPSYALSVNFGSGGTASGGGTFEHGINVPITANPNPGFSFAGWTGTGVGELNSSSTTVAMTEAKTVTASFTISQHSLIVSSGTGGSVSGDGNFSHGSMAPISATPDLGYSFTGWSGNGVTSLNSASTTVSMTEARTVSATFSPNQYALSITAGTGGSVSGGGNFSYGSTAPITATPSMGYSFVGWTGSGVADRNTASTSVSMTESRTISATFSPNQYSLLLFAGTGGNVIGEGNFSHGAFATITATPSAEYFFERWIGAGVTEANSSSTTVDMSSDRNVSASFAQPTVKHALTLSAGNGGTVSGQGLFSHDSLAPITANPNVGYSFSGWTGAGVNNPASSSTTVNMSEARTVEAKFSFNQYTLLLYAGMGGSILGEGNFSHGTIATITATPDSGYSFAGWTGAGVTDLSSPSTTINMTEARAISASFTANQYSLFLSAGSGGNVSGEGNFSHGTDASITATPSPGYSFDGWTGEGVNDLSSNSTSVNMIENRSVYASFSPAQYRLILSAGSGGNVTGEGNFSYNTNAQIIASPNPGYTFSSWAGTGVFNPALSSTTVSMTESRIISAIFTPIQYTLTLSAGAGGSVTGEGNFSHNSIASIQASPVRGYTFTRWSDNEVSDTTATSTTVSMTQNRSISAIFSINQYSLSIRTGSGGSISGSGIYDYGKLIPINAVPSTGFIFTGWNGEGIADANASSTTISLSSNQLISATFVKKPPNFQVLTINSSPSNAGTTTGSGSYEQGRSVNITAQPLEGHSFVEWLGDGILDSNSTSSSVDLNADLNLTASFVINSYQLKLIGGAGGTLRGAGIYPYLSTVEITAQPSDGYSFLRWNGQGVSNPIALLTSVILLDDRNITAEFSLKQYPLTLTAQTGGMVQGTGLFLHGSSPRIEAISSQGYKFKTWNGIGVTDPSSAVTSVLLSEPKTITAIFEPLSVTNLSGSTPIKDDWYDSNWFGFFFQSNSNWCYHFKLGWINPVAQEEDNLWVWSPALKWLWLDSKNFPKSYAWMESEKDWVYFDFDASPVAKIYHFSSGTWATFP